MDPSAMALQDALSVLPRGPDVDPGTDVLLRAVGAVQQAVCISDVAAPDQPLVWANEAFATMTGFTLEESLGRNCRFLQEGMPDRGYDTAGPAARIREMIASGSSGTVVIPNRRRDETVFVNELSFSPLVEPDGSIRYYVAVQRDVTTRVRAESARDTAHLETADLSQQLQRQLVPHRLPDVAGLEVAVRYRPATRSDGSRGEVSGDFYDLRVRPDGDAFAVIGDVSGRGPRAAATTAALRWAIRGAAGLTSGPAALLELVADAVHDALDDRFGTVAVARYRPHEPTVTIALAGHPQLVLVPAAGEPRLVGTPGTLLGPFGAVELQDTDVGFGVGDCLLLYTDGVTEAQSPSRELMGEAELLHALAELGPAEPQRLADAVLDTVAHHVGSGPTDDLTLMALRRTELIGR